jgi:hypothetical protein
MAQGLNTNADFIMSVSAWESGWPGTHAQQIGNLFGLTNAGGLDLSFAKSGGCQAWANYWVNRVGPSVQNSRTMQDFLSGLKKEGYNTNPSCYINVGNQLQWVQKWESVCVK